MFDYCAKTITRYWWAVILLWVAAVVSVKAVAPNWDDIAYDGDLAYLPETLPSFVGEKLLADAFPQDRAKSQMVVVIARDQQSLSTNDLDVAYDVARRFKNYLGATAFERARQLQTESQQQRAEGSSDAAERSAARAVTALLEAETALDAAIEFDSLLAKHYEQRFDAAADLEQKFVAKPPRLAAAYWNRARLRQHLKRDEEASADRERAVELDPKLATVGDQAWPENATKLPLLDVWMWRDELVGSKLVDKQKQARLVVLQLSNEFMATDNIEVLEALEQELAPVKEFANKLGVSLPNDPKNSLHVGISGSAAVGGDMLRSAQESIRHTELFTVIIVVLILAVVYRSPLLVVVPLVTIFASLQLSMGVVALLTQLHLVPGFAWWDLKVFTTTQIFIVVILFGAGTDFCLFLVARFREELEHGLPQKEASAKALAAVADALIASAMTTILGLGMMYFANFGKYTYSGPVIGLCLFITLLACLTLAPALLQASGSWLFWPGKITPRGDNEIRGIFDLFWQKSARWIVAYPIPILIGSVLILFPAAWHGFTHGEHVTYDFLSGLSDNSPSKIGTRMLQQHFPIGESGPLVVLVQRPQSQWDDSEHRTELAQLSADLQTIDGVTAVRSATNPLGEKIKPRTGVLGTIRRSGAASHKLSTEVYVSQTPGFQGDVTRLELILADNPFSVESLAVLERLDERLQKLTSDEVGYWRDATFAYAGATAGLRDLRDVTRSDNRRIQLLVVIAVFLVLLAVLRKPLICAYMIVSVLFSYYVTIGSTEFFFAWLHGPGYPGLDWKV
ncbi:MAG TPA: MMPL family transporter, partial [Pirellulaceae bacterium]|nr:MMPL family transporter [Pirellulaceae bacterium]